MSYRDPFAYDDALAAVHDHMERWDRLTRSPAIESAIDTSQKLARQIDTLTGRSLVGQVAEATGAVQPAFEDLSARMDMLTRQSLAAQVAEATIAVPRSAYEDSIATVDMVGDLTNPASVLEDQVMRAPAMLPPVHELDRISALDCQIRGSLPHIDWERLHGLFHFGDELGRLTGDLTSAYQELAIPPIRSESLFALNTLPAIELHAHASLLDALGYFGTAAPAEADQEETEESRVHEAIDEGARVTLVALLADYDPDLLELLRAGDEALTNEYYAAMKFCFARRELLRKLLQKAAPDRAVRKWTTNPNYVSQRDSKFVTMPGRIAYICDRASLSGYARFAITDQKAAKEVWGMLNKGAKQIPGRLTPRQVAELRIRSNCLILMALQLAIKARN